MYIDIYRYIYIILYTKTYAHINIYEKTASL